MQAYASLRTDQYPPFNLQAGLGDRSETGHDGCAPRRSPAGTAGAPRTRPARSARPVADRSEQFPPCLCSTQPYGMFCMIDSLAGWPLTGGFDSVWGQAHIRVRFVCRRNDFRSGGHTGDATWCPRTDLSGSGVSLERKALPGLRHLDSKLRATNNSGQFAWDKSAAYAPTPPGTQSTPTRSSAQIMLRWYNDDAWRTFIGNAKAAKALVDGILYRDFDNSPAYWGQNTGVHNVWGPILTKYIAVGGHKMWMRSGTPMARRTSRAPTTIPSTGCRSSTATAPGHTWCKATSGTTGNRRAGRTAASVSRSPTSTTGARTCAAERVPELLHRL